MLQELLVELLKRAHAEQSVALAATEDGVQLLAYPLDQGMLVGVGLEGQRAQFFDGAALLRTRAGDMERFGSWLPSQLKDGAWYVVKRLPAFDPYAPALDERDLDAAVELIS
jgi:hypothetical protein